MIKEVRAAQDVYSKAHQLYGDERSEHGVPSEYDFVSGPLAAAIFGFRDFHNLPYHLTPEVRACTVLDHVFGPVVFAAALLEDGIVEIVDFTNDPDYWALIEDDPA